VLGYVHALAYLCFRDNVIPHTGDMSEADMQKMFATSPRFPTMETVAALISP